jgi:RNA polymerase sigma-70 factor (ECF subfamily)
MAGEATLAPLDDAVQKFLAGDNAAFARIVSETSAALVRLGARMMGNLADGEDVVQQAYMKAHRALLAGKFDGRARVQTWLYRILVNEAIDAKRRQGPKANFADTGALPNWDGQSVAEARLALAELSSWLAVLPPDQQATLIMSAMEGLSSAEIAQVMQCSEGAVEQRLVRARAALRQRRGES